MSKSLEQYATTQWKGRPNYQCPHCPAYSTISESTFRGHLRGHAKAKAKKAQAAEPAGGKKSPAKKKKGGK